MISQLYHYVAAVVGVGMLLGGTIAALFGLREILLPRVGESAGGGVRSLLQGLVFALPGLALVWGHLREARRREGAPVAPAFWGRSLYFHLVALVALVFLLIGTVGVLGGLVDLAAPLCPPSELVSQVNGCVPTAAEAGRQILDMSIVAAVGGPVWWWHLRQGGRLGQGPPITPEDG